MENVMSEAAETTVNESGMVVDLPQLFKAVTVLLSAIAATVAPMLITPDESKVPPLGKAGAIEKVRFC